MGRGIRDGVDTAIQLDRASRYFRHQPLFGHTGVGKAMGQMGGRMGTVAKAGFSKVLGFCSAHPLLLAGVGAAIGGFFLCKKLFGRKGKQRKQMKQLFNQSPEMAQWAQANWDPSMNEKKNLDRLRKMAKAAGYPTKAEELGQKPLPQPQFAGPGMLPFIPVPVPVPVWPCACQMAAMRLSMLRAHGILV